MEKSKPLESLTMMRIGIKHLLEIAKLFQQSIKLKITSIIKNGTAMQAWSPLAQGMIKLSDQDVLKKIGKKYNKTPAQIVLRFLTQRRISVIPKSKHEIRLIENIDIFDFKLDDEEIKQIRQLDKNDTLFTWTKRF